MKITITIDDGEREVEIVREVRPERTDRREGDVDLSYVEDDSRALDRTFVEAVVDARRALKLPQHDQTAMRYLASLPHPSSPMLAGWRVPRPPMSLTEFVNELRPLLPPHSVDAPDLRPATDSVDEAAPVDADERGWPMIVDLRALVEREVNRRFDAVADEITGQITRTRGAE